MFNCPKNKNICLFVTLFIAAFLNQKVHALKPNQVVDYTKEDKWGGECVDGEAQSPIDIKTDNIVICPKETQFRFDYSKSHFGVHPKGTRLKIDFANQTFVTYTKNNQTQKYHSVQYHWHFPSEHLINSKKYALQLHIVHQMTPQPKDHHKYAVVAILFQQNEFVHQDIFDTVDFIDDSEIQYDFPFDLQDSHVYHYSGSFTVPSCDQNLEWFVFKKTFKIRTQNLNNFKSHINHGKPNARSAQKQNGRTIGLLSPHCRNR